MLAKILYVRFMNKTCSQSARTSLNKTKYTFSENRLIFYTVLLVSQIDLVLRMVRYFYWKIRQILIKNGVFLQSKPFQRTGVRRITLETVVLKPNGLCF